MAEIVPFPQELARLPNAQYVWNCLCGHNGFLILGDGTLECQHCGRVPPHKWFDPTEKPE